MKELSKMTTAGDQKKNQSTILTRMILTTMIKSTEDSKTYQRDFIK
jgi:hypothetical protein